MQAFNDGLKLKDLLIVQVGGHPQVLIQHLLPLDLLLVRRFLFFSGLTQLSKVCVS